MPNYITVDSGTTNTRVSLVVDGKIIDGVKFKNAAPDVESRKKNLAANIRDSVKKLLEQNSKSEGDICRILACGMITSDIGLVSLPHIEAPCGINELSQNLYETVLEDVSPIPFVFVRGVKTVSAEHIDMMRGEEAEIFGICETPEKNSLYVLPGSHSKLIFIDNKGRISHFSTELTGELMGAIANNTILSSIIDLDGKASSAEYLQKGYLCSTEMGMNAALFKVRALKMFSSATDEEIFSFFRGVVLAPEVNNIIKSDAEKVIIGGKKQLKEPTAILVRQNSSKQVETVCEEVTDAATTYGCIRIFENSIK